MKQLNEIKPTQQERIETLETVCKELMETVDYCKQRIEALTATALLESQAREELENQIRNIIHQKEQEDNYKLWKAD